MQDVGACLEEDSPDVLHAIFYELRRILQEGRVPKRTQYQIETLMATRKAGFVASGHPAMKEELDLVEEDDKVTHDQVCSPAPLPRKASGPAPGTVLPWPSARWHAGCAIHRRGG